ncbi:MAG: hypothetical protein QM698_16740 [Micropepsaceae bacterium]
MNARLTLALAAIALASCAGPKPLTFKQQQTASSANCLLGPFVRNADGSLTWEELQAGLDVTFKTLDLDGDGYLSGFEITKVNEARTGTCDTSSLIDWSGTGRIDRDTFAARYETTFGFADRERDGRVTAIEMATAPSRSEPKKEAPRISPQQNDPTQMPGGLPNTNGRY